MIAARKIEELFGQQPVSGSYLPESIRRSLSAAGRQTSVLQEVQSPPVAALVRTAATLVQGLAFLPVDPEADARIEQFMATQLGPTKRRPIPRK